MPSSPLCFVRQLVIGKNITVDNTVMAARQFAMQLSRPD